MIAGKFLRRAGTLAAVALTATMGSAYAGPDIVITPTVEVASTTGSQTASNIGTGLPNFADTQAAGQYWGLEVANTANRYDTNQLSIDRVDATTITFTMRTAFTGTQTLANGVGTVRYADLMFTNRNTAALDTPNSNWAFGIALGGNIDGGGTGQELNGGVAAGVYAIDSASDYLTSSQIWSGRSGYSYGGYVAEISDVNYVAAHPELGTENLGHVAGTACTAANPANCVGTWNNTVVGHTPATTCNIAATDCAGTWTNTTSSHHIGDTCVNTNSTYCGNKHYTDFLDSHASGAPCSVSNTNCTGLKWTTTDAGHTTPIAEIQPATRITSTADLITGLTVDVMRTISGNYLWTSDGIIHSLGGTCATTDADCAGKWTNTVVSHTSGGTCAVAATDCNGTWNNNYNGHHIGDVCTNTADAHCINKKWTDTVVGHTSGTACSGTADAACGTKKWTDTLYSHHAGDACTTPGSSCVALEWDGADGSHAAGTPCYAASTHCIGFYDLTVSVTGSKIMLDSLFDNFDILWGTGDCSNDALWGSVHLDVVPTPGALALLGFGLLAMGVTRRRTTGSSR